MTESPIVSPFAALGLAADLANAVTEAGYANPTPIQAQAIPPLLEGKDFVGVADLGSGVKLEMTAIAARPTSS